MSDTSTAVPVTPSKQSKAPTIILGIAFTVALIAAVLLFIRANALQDKIAQLQSQLDQTQSLLNQANNQIAQLQPLAQKARQMPVSITFRQALMGGGYVVQFHNKSGKNLPLKITVKNPTFNKTKTFDAVANAGPKPLEIGHMEGWTFASGDVIEVVSEGFDPIEAKIP